MKCPRCGGPAVRLDQSGEISCAKQCDETVIEMAKRNMLEETTAILARELGPKMPAKTGFILTLCHFDLGGAMAYASSFEREGALHLLRELLDKMELESPPSPPSESECPCCFPCLAPGLDTERALIGVYIIGRHSRRKVSLTEMLCERHAKLAEDAIGFVRERL